MTVYINTDIKMEFQECCACGIPFAMTIEFAKARRRDVKRFYCPNGCSMTFSASTEAKLRKQLAAERARHDQTRAREADVWKEYNKLERSKAAVQGHLTRVKKRVGNGVCPCCNRTFKNLARHMGSKHPDYKDGA